MDKKVLDRILKLKSLAEKTSFEGEAGAALEKMQELMDQYKVTMCDLDVNSRENNLGPLEAETAVEERRFYSWEYTLANVLASLFECEMYVQGFSNSKKRNMNFVGREGNVKTAILMFQWLDKEILNQASKYKKGSARGKWLGFCVGFVERISAKVKEITNSRKTEVKANETSLILVSEAKQWLSENIQNMREFTPARGCLNRNALFEGSEAAKDISLNKQFGLKAIEA